MGGRGGNARIHTFQLDHHGPTDGRTDKASYRVACPQLKMKDISTQQITVFFFHSYLLLLMISRLYKSNLFTSQSRYIDRFLDADSKVFFITAFACLYFGYCIDT